MSPALTDTFPRKDYQEPEQRFNGEIRDWASFLELCDPDSRKLLAGFMSVGEPTQ